MLTPDGRRPIESLEVGDLVPGTDPQSGRHTEQRVTSRFTRAVPLVVDLSVGDSMISCSTSHPFWVPGTGWVTAGDLGPGSLLLTAEGEQAVIAEVARRNGSFAVHNLSVDGPRTYHVGEPGVLVHNKSAKYQPEVPATPEVQAARDLANDKLYDLKARAAQAIDEVPEGSPEHSRLEDLREALGECTMVCTMRVLRTAFRTS